MTDTTTHAAQPGEHGAEPAETTSTYVPVTRDTAPPRTEGRRGTGALLGVLTVLLVVVFGMQVYVINAVANNGSGLDDLNAAVFTVQNELVTANSRVSDISSRLDSLETQGVVGATGSTSGPSSAPAVPGGLPIFQETQNDPAVLDQVVLGSVTGPEFYSGQTLSIDPTDGIARVWLIWAHWCPYCQQELPVLKEWWPANGGTYPHTEIVTITTSIDETRDNPLVPYLETQQFPFPVLVDEDLQLALQFGTVAYPYWVVTGGDGTVVLRATGLLEPSQMEGLFTELERIATEA